MDILLFFHCTTPEGEDEFLSIVNRDRQVSRGKREERRETLSLLAKKSETASSERDG